VKITEELREWKNSGSGSRKSRLVAVGIRCANHATPSIRKKLALTSPTSGSRSVGIVSLRRNAMEFLYNPVVYLFYRQKKFGVKIKVNLSLCLIN
jgi:hypothetical protein